MKRYLAPTDKSVMMEAPATGFSIQVIWPTFSFKDM